jgi:1-acyl-sn-glycerol-3-phosphate acyltransferase
MFLGVWTAFMVSYAVIAGALLRDPEFFRREQRRWARGLLRFWGVRLEVFGSEQMRQGVSYVVMSNHLSWADIVALFIALPTTPGFLAKRELMRIPFLAQALRSGRHVLIDRAKRGDAMAALARAAEQVRSGNTVLIFPEGTRGDSDTIGAFKKGGFHLAREAKVPILPVGLRGSRGVFPRGGLLVYPGTIEVHIGAEVPADEVADAELGAMLPRVRAKIMDLAAMEARGSESGPLSNPPTSPEPRTSS